MRQAPPDVSVLIPTHQRPEKVSACVAALASQTLGPGRSEVLVGIDGEPGARATLDAVRAAWTAHAGAGRDHELRAEVYPKGGQASVRNRLLNLARGTTLVFLNDDMRPEPGLLAAHLAAQRDQAKRPALVIGSAPWVVRTPDRLFDRLLRETSMVFFYDRMDAARDERERDWGFRHAWLLNLSAPADLVRSAGGFRVFPSTYGYEDDELAFRLAERFGTRVLYRPEAVAHHDHAMDPEDYLERERRLGFSAWGFAQEAPDCARAMFGRDVGSPEELAYAQDALERERVAAERVRGAFLGLAGMPASLLEGEHASALRTILYQHHLPLKRWCWRAGLLEAAGVGVPRARAA